MVRGKVVTTALLSWCVACLGCAAVPLPAIDPTGERIFLPSPSYTTFVSPYDSISQLGCLPRPAFTEPPPIPPCEFAPPGRPPGPVGTGIVPQLYPDRLTLSPARIVAPINSEVMLMAGVCGREGHYITKQPIEWMLSPDSVGNIIALDDADHPQIAKLVHHGARKECNNLAITRTSTSARYVTRGTPLQNDDAWVSKGQTWISVSSPTEGVSYVTAVAKRGENWETRRQTAAIYWVDMQWAFPAPQIVPAGQPCQLVTAVTKTSTGNPSANAVVRYEVVGGAPAFFAGGRTDMRVPTDENGRAVVQLFQDPVGPGSTQVRIQILASGVRGESGSDAVIGQGFTTITWRAAGLGIQIIGPQVIARGGVATFRIDVSNPGDLPTQGVGVRIDVPQPLKYLNSQPAAQVYGNTLEWSLGELAPQQTQSIQLNCQAVNSGEFQMSARASTSTQGVAQATTHTEIRVVESGVSVRFVDPPTAAVVGNRVVFNFEVTNTGGAPLTNVVVRDTFDAGLRPDYNLPPNEPVQLALGNLAPGATIQKSIALVPRTAGQQCQTLEVRAEGGHTASTRACVAVTQPVLRVDLRKVGPQEARVGDRVRFVIELTNTGEGVLTNLQITDRPDQNLLADRATDSAKRREADKAIVWTAATLSPQQSLTLEIECVCLTEAASAQNLVEVAADGGLREVAEARLPILPRQQAATPQPAPAQPGQPGQPPARPEGQLEVQVASLGDRAVGGTAEFMVMLRNVSDQQVDEAQVTVFLPREFGESGVRTTLQNYDVARVTGGLSIGPIRTIRGSEALPAIKVDAIANKPGKYRVRVRVESRNAPMVESETEITIVPAN